MIRFEPDDGAIAALASKLRTAGWRYGAHVSMSDGGLYRQLSRCDRRVAAVTFVSKRSQEKSVYRFADPHVEVEAAPDGPIILDEGREFSTLEELARAILMHEHALAEAREWQAAAPAEAPVEERASS